MLVLILILLGAVDSHYNAEGVRCNSFLLVGTHVKTTISKIDYTNINKSSSR